MQRTISNVTFIEGVPADLESMINPSIPNLVLIDDLMTELCSNRGLPTYLPRAAITAT